MNKRMNKHVLSSILCFVLIAAMALAFTGCNNTAEKPADGTVTTVTTVTTVPADTTDTSADADVKAVGEGETNFTFTVVEADGKETVFSVNTDKKTVGEALTDVELIEGTVGDYGLYVTKVNGVEAIYENDGTYWAFYINGEYAMTGVDSTDVEAGAEYMFKVEK